MSSTVQTVLVCVIVALAALRLGYGLYRTLFVRKAKLGCGSGGGGCGNCAHNSSEPQLLSIQPLDARR